MSILIIGIALGGVGLGTFAWFTNNTDINNNVLTTGNVNLEVRAYNADGTRVNQFTVGGLLPGEETTVGYVALRNTGTADIKWRGYLQLTDGTALSPLRITMIAQPDDFDPGFGSGVYEGPGVNEETVSWATWAEISSPSNTPLNSGDVWAHKPGVYQYFKVVAKLDDNAGNSWQGVSMTARLRFDVTQSNNPEWSQTTPVEP